MLRVKSVLAAILCLNMLFNCTVVVHYICRLTRTCYSNLNLPFVQWIFQLCLWYIQEILVLILHHLILGSIVLRGDCHGLCLGSTGVNNFPLGSWSPTSDLYLARLLAQATWLTAPGGKAISAWCRLQPIDPSDFTTCDALRYHSQPKVVEEAVQPACATATSSTSSLLWTQLFHVSTILAAAAEGT